MRVRVLLAGRKKVLQPFRFRRVQITGVTGINTRGIDPVLLQPVGRLGDLVLKLRGEVERSVSAKTVQATQTVLEKIPAFVRTLRGAGHIALYVGQPRAARSLRPNVVIHRAPVRQLATHDGILQIDRHATSGTKRSQTNQLRFASAEIGFQNDGTTFNSKISQPLRRIIGNVFRSRLPSQEIPF